MKFIHYLKKIIKSVSECDYVFLCAKIYVFFLLQYRLNKQKMRLIRKRIKNAKENMQENFVWTAARIFVFLFMGIQRIRSNSIPRLRFSSVLIGIFVVLVLTPGIYFAEEADTEDAYQWLEGEPFIAHGMGQVDGLTITNSLEAFLFNYQAGYRVFEVDLTTTSDDVLVLRHENWRYIDNEEGIPQLTNEPMTYQEFRELKPGGTLTTLSFEDLAMIMEKYPDIRIITDTKTDNKDMVKKQFDQMVATINKLDPSLIKRITPQFYSEGMFLQLSSNYGFESYIYTLYLSNLETDGIIEFMKKNNLKMLTIPEERVSAGFIADLKANGIYSGVHTVYTRESYDRLKGMGVDAFYTDTFILDN